MKLLATILTAWMLTSNGAFSSEAGNLSPNTSPLVIFTSSTDNEDPDSQELHHGYQLACFKNTTNRRIPIRLYLDGGPITYHSIPSDPKQVTKVWYIPENSWPQPHIILEYNAKPDYYRLQSRSILTYQVPSLDCTQWGTKFLFAWSDDSKTYIEHYRCPDSGCKEAPEKVP